MPNRISKILIEIQAHAEENCPFIFLSKKRYEPVRKKWHRYRSENRISEWHNKDMPNNVLRDFKAKK